jgi:transcriptional regulator with XRE-family HTH domain
VALLKQEAVGAHVRELRLAAKISLRTLAARTEFSPSFISQLENGLVSPSIHSMQKIAEALGVTLGEFFAAASHGTAGTIVRVKERESILSSWSQAAVESLVPPEVRAPLEAMLMTLEPGGRSGKHPYPRAHAEFAFVLEGRVHLTLGPETHQLAKGDSVSILPRELRVWANDGEQPVRVLIVSASAAEPEPQRPRKGRRR